MTGKMLFDWAFKRILGLRDIPLLVNHLKTKKKKALTGQNTIQVIEDEQLDHSVEAMEGHTESCPYWYSTRLFKGKENYPSQKDPEYWVGIRCTFLMPVIPIPICSDEKVFKIGNTSDIYYDSYHRYGRFYSLLLHYKDYSMNRIYSECTVYFNKEDITYKNDEVWSAYD